MKATLEAFLQSLQKLSREQLIQKLVQMKEDEISQSVILTEMRNTSTAMTREYNKIQESNRKLQEENIQLKKDNKRLCEENAHLLRKVFGRQSEKVIYMDEENVPEDPLSEEAEDTEEPANEKPTDLPGTPAVGKAGLTVLPGKKGNEKKKPRHGMNLDKLPADHIFNVNAEKLDALYGEGNWTIISWHVRRKVERIPELDYVQYTHVPVVAVGPERKLVALPFEDESFDAVVSLNGFHAFPGKDAAYNETFRVLRKGGIFTGCFYVEKANARTDKWINGFYVKRGFFTPPFETVGSLLERLGSMYGSVEVSNVKSIAVFRCIK